MPDFLVYYKDGTKKLCEVKCDYTATVNNFDKKQEVAKVWCASNSSTFEVVKELQILQYETSLNI